LPLYGSGGHVLLYSTHFTSLRQGTGNNSFCFAVVKPPGRLGQIFPTDTCGRWLFKRLLEQSAVCALEISFFIENVEVN
jgi:hypothetical protein